MNGTSRLIAAVALGLPIVSHAGPDDYVAVPTVEYGEHEIALLFGTAKAKDSQGGGRTSAGSIEFGYGAAPWWYTEAYLKFAKDPGDKTKYDAVEWENKFQLTEPNQYFADFGLLTEIEIPKKRHEEGYELRIGPLVQFDTGSVRWNANVFFERIYRSRVEGEHPMEMVYQLQARHMLARDTEVGFQAFGEMGKWNHWEPREEQSHQVGPALFGKVRLGGREAIRYNAAYLFGTGGAAPKSTLRLQTEYEF